MKLLSVAQHKALMEALPAICQFLELVALNYSEVQEETLEEMDLSDEAWVEAVEAMHAPIKYRRGE